MKKTLVFAPDTVSERRFNFLYKGFLLGQIERKNIEILRCEGRILDKLEAISKASNNSNDMTRTLTAPAILELEQAEIALIQQYILSVAWVPAVSRSVVDLIDWLAAAKVE